MKGFPGECFSNTSSNATWDNSIDLSDIRGFSAHDLEGGLGDTDDFRGRIHLAVEIGSVTGKELDRSHRSMMVVADGSMRVIEGKVKLPLTIEGVTRLCEVRFAEHLDTEEILGLDAEAEFDIYFGSSLKKVFMPDASGRHNSLMMWLVEEEGCGAIADLSDDEQVRLKGLIDEKLPPTVEGQLKTTHLATHHIHVQGHPLIKQRYPVVSPKVQEAMYQEVTRQLPVGGSIEY